ncbi:putative membrane protein [Pseudomonas phage Ka1]|nr:putative membrane protein [Pseudomonas phage Ka1]
MNGFVFAAIVMLGLAIGWVIGATSVVRNDAPAVENKWEVVGGSFGNKVLRFYDHEEGVVCYFGGGGLSCLRLVKAP